MKEPARPDVSGLFCTVIVDERDSFWLPVNDPLFFWQPAEFGLVFSMLEGWGCFSFLWLSIADTLCEPTKVSFCFAPRVTAWKGLLTLTIR